MSSDKVAAGDVVVQGGSEAAVDEGPLEHAESQQSPEAALPAAAAILPGSETRSEPPRPRVRLNPTIGTEQARPFPTVPASAAPVTPTATQPAPAPGEPAEAANTPPSAAVARVADAAEKSAASAEPESEPAAGPSAPVEVREEVPVVPARSNGAPHRVELPPKDLPLDPALEAEIAAAMSADTSSVGTVTEAVAGEAAALESATETALQPGMKVKGLVQSIHAENVFFDLGLRWPGLVQLRHFAGSRPPGVGETVEVIVDRVDEEEGLVHLSLPRAARRVGGNWDALSVGQTVECTVTKTNKGGLEVQVGSLRGFLPAGQVDFGFVSDLEPYVGQKLRVQVLEVNPRRRNLVVSRKALLEAERREAEEMLWAKLELGQTFIGKVRTIKDYGVFVDLGGVDGFMHIGEMSWNRIKHPSEVVHEGQEVEVKVVSLDHEKKRIGLGMKQMTPNPWLTAAEKYPVGSTVTGTVTRTTNFGAFIELEQGVEGLVHISELDHRRVKSVTDVLAVGQQTDFRVLEIDPERKRISLSLKALLKKPEPEAKPKAEPEPETPQYTRKHTGKLKGGMGDAPVGKLFGDPRNFK